MFAPITLAGQMEINSRQEAGAPRVLSDRSIRHSTGERRCISAGRLNGCGFRNVGEEEAILPTITAYGFDSFGSQLTVGCCTAIQLLPATILGNSSPILPRSTASANSSISVGSALTITILAPDCLAVGTTAATG